MKYVLAPGFGEDGWNYGFGLAKEGSDWILKAISPCCWGTVTYMWETTNGVVCDECGAKLTHGYSDSTCELEAESLTGWVRAWLGLTSWDDKVKVEVEW